MRNNLKDQDSRGDIDGNGTLIRTVENRKPEIITSKSVKLETYPSYMDSRFDTPQTVFGKEEEGISYDYDDRLWQWDYAAHERALEKAKESKKTLRSAEYYEVYLSEYFGVPTEVKHIMAGVNRSNGYPYVIFGYKKG